MTRLLPLLFLALLPAAVVAPVPPGGRVEFGTNGLLSRADLEKVLFDSRPYEGDEVRNRPDEPEPAEKRAEDPDAPRPKNRYDLAVHMPWTRFREDEPIPAYFVLRNNRDSTLGLHSRIDLSGPTATMHGGDASFDIRDRATGKSVVALKSVTTNCGGGSLVDVPAKGFYCEKGELNRLAGVTLPPGEYEVDWRYGRLASAPVRFTVTKVEGAKPAALAQRPHVRFVHLSDRPERLKELRAIDEPLAWHDCHLGGAYTQSMSAALAVGQHGVYIPDMRTIPAADKFVEAWIEWKPYREGDRVSVTLRAAPPHREVWFDEMPQFVLQIEAPSVGLGRVDWSRNSCGDLKRSERERLTTPLTIELQLPRDWRERVDVLDSARVAVLVVAKPIEFPRGARDEIQRLRDEKRLVRREDRPPVWSGIVRTDFTELQFPSAFPTRER